MSASPLRAVQHPLPRDLAPVAAGALCTRPERLPARGRRCGGESGQGRTSRGAATRLLLRRLFFAVAAMSASHAATAFLFSDGTTMRCFAAGEPVTEYDAPPTHRLVIDNHAGLVERNGLGYRIAWNAAILRRLPPEMHDFIFFHECAHASVPTPDEVLANCVGLKTMRAVGRGGFAVEAHLSAFYGPASDYWRQTLACANDTGHPPPPVPH